MDEVEEEGDPYYSLKGIEDDIHFVCMRLLRGTKWIGWGMETPEDANETLCMLLMRAVEFGHGLRPTKELEDVLVKMANEQTWMKLVEFQGAMFGLLRQTENRGDIRRAIAEWKDVMRTSCRKTETCNKDVATWAFIWSLLEIEDWEYLHGLIDRGLVLDGDAMKRTYQFRWYFTGPLSDFLGYRYKNKSPLKIKFESFDSICKILQVRSATSLYLRGMFIFKDASGEAGYDASEVRLLMEAVPKDPARRIANAIAKRDEAAARKLFKEEISVMGRILVDEVYSALFLPPLLGEEKRLSAIQEDLTWFASQCEGDSKLVITEEEDSMGFLSSIIDDVPGLYLCRAFGPLSESDGLRFSAAIKRANIKLVLKVRDVFEELGLFSRDEESVIFPYVDKEANDAILRREQQEKTGKVQRVSEWDWE